MQSPPKAKNKSQNKSTGDIGEETAVSLLKESGYKILDTNYRTRFAELDIVAIDGDTLVFIEVKTRRNTKYGLPEEAVNERKIHKIKLAGQLYVKEHAALPKKHRIDVVSILLDKNEVSSVRLIKVA